MHAFGCPAANDEHAMCLCSHPSSGMVLPQEYGLLMEEILGRLGYKPTPTSVEQLAVLMEAFAIFQERNGRYRDEWRRTGWRGALFETRKKVSRVWQCFWTGASTKDPAMLYDDVFDAINFMIFFVRLHRDGGDADWGEWTGR